MNDNKQPWGLGCPPTSYKCKKCGSSGDGVLHFDGDNGPYCTKCYPPPTAADKQTRALQGEGETAEAAPPPTADAARKPPQMSRPDQPRTLGELVTMIRDARESSGVVELECYSDEIGMLLAEIDKIEKLVAALEKMR